jgi:very-short-patch-repair endonuclease
MWRILYSLRTNGYHFRKQVPIGPYYADIACHHAKLIIEVDGGTHSTDAELEHDARRDSFLQRDGYTVLRFTNTDVLENPDGVFDAVTRALEGRPKNLRSRSPHPSPSVDVPSPSLPIKGRVPLRDSGTIEPNTPDGTSPFMGEDGRGPSK